MKKTFSMALLVLIAVQSGFAQQSNQATERTVYGALDTKSVFVHQDLRSVLREDQIAEIIDTNRPFSVKVIAVPKLGNKWYSNKIEMRANFAKFVFVEKMRMDEGLVIVVTSSGITGYSPKISTNLMQSLCDEAARSAFKSNFTPAVEKLVTLVRAELAGNASTGSSSSVKQPASPEKAGSGMGIWPWLIGAGVIGAGVFQISKAQKLVNANSTSTKYRENAVQGISFIDAYDGFDLGTETQNIKDLRSSGYEYYESGLSKLKVAKTILDHDGAQGEFQRSIQESSTAIEKIRTVTGEGASAFKPLHSLEEGDQTKAPIFEPTKDACFFTGQADEGQLTPVEMVIDGQRRTVMASPTAIEQIKNGQMPQIAGAMEGNRMVPWYAMRDSRMNMGGGGGMDFFPMMMLTSMMNPFSHTHYNDYSSSGFGNAGGWGQNHSNDFGSSSNSGGGDFGFGNNSGSGGGDFDFGGGGDSGGGGGGGDFGGD